MFFKFDRFIAAVAIVAALSGCGGGPRRPDVVAIHGVVTLDGNPVPTPKSVDVLQLGTAERIDAVVEMSRPGIWILGTPRDDDRRNGMGIVVEYAGSRGRPRWVAPPRSRWDYTIFGGRRPAPNPDRVIPMVIGKISGGKGGFNRWTINGKRYDEQGEPTKLQKGLRYRLAFENRTDAVARFVNVHAPAGFDLRLEED